MRVCPISFIHIASLNTSIYLLPMSDVYPVVANTVGTTFIEVSHLYISLDTSPVTHIDVAATFCPSISSYNPYFDLGNWIWCGFQWWRDVISMCGYTSEYPWVEHQVSKNRTVPSDCSYATNSLSGLVIFIGFFWSYGLSCSSAPKLCNWFGLMRVCSISSIYNASLNTMM